MLTHVILHIYALIFFCPITHTNVYVKKTYLAIQMYSLSLYIMPTEGPLLNLLHRGEQKRNCLKFDKRRHRNELGEDDSL